MNVNYKILILGILPLPLFFVKVNGLMAVYGIIIIAIVFLLE
jgi:hypothetical protein